MKRLMPPGKRRSQSGATISEMAPALFLLVIFALLPVIDLIVDGLGYCACLTLNNLQLREAARVPKSQATDPKGAVQLAIPTNWRNSAFGGIAPLMDDPQTSVSYDVIANSAFVTVSTVVSVKPMIPVPFFSNIPGLGAPMVFTVASQKVLENPGFLNY
jgi:hypothetical protein